MKVFRSDNKSAYLILDLDNNYEVIEEEGLSEDEIKLILEKVERRLVATEELPE